MPSEVTLILQLAVGLVFAASALGKARHPALFVGLLEEYYSIPKRLGRLAAVLLIGTECVIAISHLSGLLLAPILMLSLTLISILVGVVTWLLYTKTVAPCMCFGAKDNQPVNLRTAIRLGLLAISEIVLFLTIRGGNAPSLSSIGWVNAVTALLCSSLALALISWMFSVPELAVLARSSTRVPTRSAR